MRCGELFFLAFATNSTNQGDLLLLVLLVIYINAIIKVGHKECRMICLGKLELVYILVYLRPL